MFSLFHGRYMHVYYWFYRRAEEEIKATNVSLGLEVKICMNNWCVLHTKRAVLCTWTQMQMSLQAKLYTLSKIYSTALPKREFSVHETPLWQRTGEHQFSAQNKPFIRMLEVDVAYRSTLGTT